MHLKGFFHIIRIISIYWFIFGMNYPIHAQSFYLQSISIDEGLPGSTVYGMAQDSIGYTWLATDRGLCRYDGTFFKTYSHPVLKGNEVLDIFPIDDEIWFSDINGHLFYVKDDQIELFDLGVIKEDKELKKIFKDKRENYWISSRTGYVYRLKKERSFSYKIDTIYDLKSKSNIHSSFNKDNCIFFTNYQKIYSFSYKENRFRSKEVLPQAIRDRVFLVNFNRNLKAQLRLPQQQFLSYDLDTLENYISNNIEKLIRTPIENITFFNNLIFATQRNQLYLLDNNFELDKKIDWLPHPINRIREDKEGNLWFLTRGKGIFILYNNAFQHYQENNSNLPKNIIYELNQLPDGTLLIGTAQGWLSFKEKEKQELINYKIDNENQEFYSLTIRDSFLITAFNQIWKFDLTTKKTSLMDGSKAMNINNKGESFISNYNGIIYKDEQNDFFTIPSGRIYDFHTSKHNHLQYFGTTNGLFIFDNQTPFVDCLKTDSSCIKRYDFKIEFRYDKKKYRCYEKNPIQVYEDKNGNSIDYYIAEIEETPDSTLYVATYGGGLFYIKNDSIAVINQEDGLISNICTDVYIDDDGDIWVTTNTGLNKIDGQTKNIRSITIEDGLISNETNTVTVIDSMVYVGTSKGLTEFHKSAIANVRPAPDVFIKNINIDQRDTSILSNYNLTFRENNINIEFIALSYQSKIKYEYRMLGLNKEWVSTTQNIVRFPNLEARNYTFEVRAVTKDNKKSTTTGLYFTINPPWWNTLVFKIGVGILTLLLIGFFANWRIQRIRRKEAEKSKLDKKIATLELEALQAQMNPHFIFNVMNSIQSYIFDEDSLNASRYLDKFASLMRIFLSASKDKYISLRDEIEMLKIYTELEQMRFEDQFEVKFSIDKNLNLDLEIPSVMIQPFVENAIKHGLSLQKNGKLTITFNRDQQIIHCIVEDNGIGREKANQLKEKRKAHRSYGMDLVQQRIETINSISSNDVNISIIDLKDANKQPKGTKVIIAMPVEY